MRLRTVEIKPDECLTHGCCVHAVPEVFEELPDYSFRVREDAPQHFDRLQSRIEEVADELCPVQAVRLIYEDGSEKYPPIDFEARRLEDERIARSGRLLWAGIAAAAILAWWLL